MPGSSQDFSEFWRLMSITGQRDAFRLHCAAHYQNLIEAGEKEEAISSNKINGQIKLFLPKQTGKILRRVYFLFLGSESLICMEPLIMRRAI